MWLQLSAIKLQQQEIDDNYKTTYRLSAVYFKSNSPLCACVKECVCVCVCVSDCISAHPGNPINPETSTMRQERKREKQMEERSRYSIIL